MEGDTYYGAYLKRDEKEKKKREVEEPGPNQWRCNVCDKNVTASNRASHVKSIRHGKVMEKKGIKYDPENRKYTQNDGQEFEIGYYGNETL